jgi:hypothetical protein
MFEEAAKQIKPAVKDDAPHDEWPLSLWNICPATVADLVGRRKLAWKRWIREGDNHREVLRRPFSGINSSLLHGLLHPKHHYSRLVDIWRV